MNVNRRFFILGSAVTARMAPAQSSEKIRTAMIGTGGRGSYLLGGVLEQSDAKVAALCDINRSAAKSFFIAVEGGACRINPRAPLRH